MRQHLISAIGAVLIVASGVLCAQPAPSSGQKPPPGMDRMREHAEDHHHRCATPDDPKACEADRQKMKAAMDKAHDACKAVPDQDRRRCMQTTLCAQSPDPSQCNARASGQEKRREERHRAAEKARDACKGMEGDAMKQCLRDQRPAHTPPAPTPDVKHH